MTPIQQNMQARPDLFVKPNTIEPEVAQFLSWQHDHFNPLGIGTIGEAWERAGTGPLYVDNVTRAREQVELHHTRAKLMREAGNDYPAAQWANAPIIAALREI